MGDLHERLQAAVGKTTFRRLGELTETHPETVRRYMQGQAPSAQFLAGVCAAMGICGEWLLTGQGPMRTGDLRRHALREADASELLEAVANTLTDLRERMERLERFVQGLETRIRAGTRTLTHDERADEPQPLATPQPGGNGTAQQHQHPDRDGAALSTDQAIDRIRRAVAKRASEAANGAAPPVRG